MASSAAHSPSRIPLPVKSSPTPAHIPVSGMKDLIDSEHLPSSPQQSPVSHSKENGNIKVAKHDHLHSPQSQKGFETFLMTGEMIIHTNPTVSQKLMKQESEMAAYRESHVTAYRESHVTAYRESHIPRLEQNDHIQHPKSTKAPHQSVISSPKPQSKIRGPVQNNTQQLHASLHHNNSVPPLDTNHFVAMTGQVKDFPLIYAPVAEMEELSDLSQSSCSDSELGLDSDCCVPPSPSLSAGHQPAICPPHSPNTDTSRLEQAVDNLGKWLPGNSGVGLADTTFSEAPSSGDSGFVHDGHISDPDLASRSLGSDRTFSSDGNFLSDETLTEKEATVSAYNINSNVGSPSFGHVGAAGQTMIASSSGEKFAIHGGNTERLLVRTSKSHENYLQAGTNIALVNIDIEDSMAYSLDALAYRDSPDSSFDNLTSESLQMSRSLDNSPEKRSEKSTEFVPGFISMEDSKSVKLKFSKQRDDTEDASHGEINNSGNISTPCGAAMSPSHGLNLRPNNGQVKPSGDNLYSLVRDIFAGDTLQLRVPIEDIDIDGLYHQPSKAVDKPSAERLAKRLFNLEGFRKSDVSRHLCKKNDFSNLVAEEYLKFFDFQEDTLDLSLRKFLLRFSLYGETQERERVLAHFSRRFMECNPGTFNSEDACHTLTCAIMLLNSDLHSPNVGRRMTCQEFIDNLGELNDGDNFSKEVLRAIYQAIKAEPIEWAVDDVTPELEGTPIGEQAGHPQTPVVQGLGSNPFLEVPDPSKTTEYKKGYVMRKSCMEPDRRKTPFGKRGWKMLYAVLRDMILYHYKDEHQLKKGHFVDSSHNAIRIHHSLATKALDYTKKQHVFRLLTADWAEYLFQTGDSKELQEWVDTINLVAASLSSPVLPGAVGSKTKFQRQLLPASCTRFNLREQLHSHESRAQDLEQELHSHRTAAPEKGAKSSVIQEYLDKESYLEFEIKRFKTYVHLLQGKQSTFPELEPSLVEITIGEYEEMGAGPSHTSATQPAVLATAAKGKPVQRSMSDSYPTESDGTSSLMRAPVINELSECTKM